MKLTSSAFQEGGVIPSIYSFEGKNYNPPLSISGVDPKAKSLVLIIDDHDVPKSICPDGIYDHWIVYNIAPQTREIAEHAAPPGIQGKNSDGRNQYIGPCPPDREHRYHFRLYAIDKMLDLKPGATKKEVELAMEGHIIAKCALMGRYEKGKNY